MLIGEQVIYFYSDLLLLEREKVKIGSNNLGLSLIQTMLSVDVEPFPEVDFLLVTRVIK